MRNGWRRATPGTCTTWSRTRERRSDLQKVLPGARSVVVCGLNYDTAYPYSTEHDDSRQGWVARYAWGEDYHEVLADKLERLRDFTAPLCCRRRQASKLYVDTGPVVERVYAKYAGLGWFGKNTCLLDKRLGSWLLLGVLILTVPLDVDSPDTRPLRHLHPLPGRLPHQCLPRTVRPRRATLHLLPDDRTQDRNSRGPARANGQSRAGL